MYVVTKNGVYLQDVFGMFLGDRAARQFAQMAAMDDDDDYHSWCVSRLSLGGLGDVSASYRKYSHKYNADEREAYSPQGREALV